MLYKKRQLCRPPKPNHARMWFSFKICGLCYKTTTARALKRRLTTSQSTRRKNEMPGKEQALRMCWIVCFQVFCVYFTLTHTE